MQDRNGYLRFTADFSSLVMEAVSSDDGSIMDTLRLEKGDPGVKAGEPGYCK